MRPKIARSRSLVLIWVVAMALGGAAERTLAQEDALNAYPLRPPNTSSPRATLQSFQTNAITAIRQWQEGDIGTDFQHARANARRCLDLSELPPAVRSDQGGTSVLFLMELLGRVELPPLGEVPVLAEVEATGLTSWTIPDTEVTIARTEEGPYAGQFQFSALTVAQLPTFYRRARHLPYKPGALAHVYEDVTYAPGPLLPREWTTDLPRFAYDVLLGQTIWQWLAAGVSMLLAAAAIVLVYLLGHRVDHIRRAVGVRRHLGRIIATIAATQLIYATYRFIDDGINLSGTPLLVLQVTTAVIEAGAFGWLILLVLKAIGEAIIRHRATRADAVEAQLIRIVVRLLAIVGLIYLALYLADSFGIPAAPLIASLGVGGLAIALAVRPTLENIVGGFILFADKPVRVGEFCLFGDKMGTIEEIGLRSTRIRALDRTVITVPNADFAQLEIVNFTRRDRMLMQATLGLRYETTPDQLRYVLTKLRELFVAHPKVAPEPARARFTGFGECSLNVEIFLYVLSKDFNEFLGIAEDLNLRIMAIVAEAGTGFAFPSQTAYLARDHGLDAERTEAVEAEVQAWRTSGALPFPGLAPERVTTLDGSLDFPPEGSVQHHQTAQAAPVGEAAKRSRWGFRRSGATRER
jgi:MscS family membrane protein